MQPTWIELTCRVTAAMAEEAASFLVELSGNGVTVENRTVDTFSLDTITEEPVVTLTAYLSDDAAVNEKVAAVKTYLRSLDLKRPDLLDQEPQVRLIGEEDWANDWKQHFPPTRIGSRLILKPTWETCTAGDDDIVIEIDPGMAFGTGTHATTRLCLEVLEGIMTGGVPFNSDSRPARVLDVGTGSGILAIAAAKLGAEEVVAIDIDERAVAVAAENAAINGVLSDIEISTMPVERIDSSFHIVLANILAEELVRMGETLVRLVAPKGHLILSGILAEKERLVREGFAAFPLTLLEARTDEEWCCLSYRRER